VRKDVKVRRVAAKRVMELVVQVRGWVLLFYG
jgi:hypothetical protein